MTFYDENAQDFFEKTVDLDLNNLYKLFLEWIPSNGFILDAGCGSGRDAKVFLDMGYRVHAFDACETLAKLASDHIGQSVEVVRFQDFESHRKFDGIWACASLLHVPMNELPQTFDRLARCLKSQGSLYCSFKYGNEELKRDGRWFVNLNEQSLASVVKKDVFAIQKTWHTTDVRKGRGNELWLNALLTRKASSIKYD